MIELGRDLATAAFAPLDELVDVVRVRAAGVLAHARERRRKAVRVVTARRSPWTHDGSCPGRGPPHPRVVLAVTPPS